MKLTNFIVSLLSIVFERWQFREILEIVLYDKMIGSMDEARTVDVCLVFRKAFNTVCVIFMAMIHIAN